MAEAHAGQWLVRTEKNVISGPYTRDQLRELIASGAIGPSDEVCDANVYWFYLHEADEVKKQLGIAVPRVAAPGDDDEITETETISNLSIPASTATREAYEQYEQEDAVPELSDVSNSESTAILSNRALRQFRSKKTQAPAAMGAASASGAAGISPGTQVWGSGGNAPSSSHASHGNDPVIAGESVDEALSENQPGVNLVGILIIAVAVSAVITALVVFLRASAR